MEYGLAMWTPGMWEILLIVSVILLFFGPKKLPQLAKGLGQSFTELRKGFSSAIEDEEKP